MVTATPPDMRIAEHWIYRLSSGGAGVAARAVAVRALAEALTALRPRIGDPIALSETTMMTLAADLLRIAEENHRAELGALDQRATRRPTILRPSEVPSRDAWCSGGHPLGPECST